MLKCALLLHLAIVFCELYTLGHIKGKWNILKYYTYLQNFLALVVSLIFAVALIVCLGSNAGVPESVKGLHYVATCGLTATMFIFVVFLGRGKKVAITQDDFLPGCSPRLANGMLHYVCPILSLVSFVFLEREISLTNGLWTSIAAIPSCLYWIAYVVLSAAKLWKEPYDFAPQEGSGNLRQSLPFVLIPLSFVAISFVLWSVQ